MTITPGIYFGLDEAIYHAATTEDGRKYLGSTDINKLFRHPCDWQWGILHPEPPKKVSHFDIGSGVHDLTLLGKEAFLEKAVTSPYPDFRKKEAKEWRDAVLAQGRYILTKDENEQVIAAAGAILNSPNLQSEFTRGVPEVSVFAEGDGVPIKARFDYLKIRGVVDLKTFSEKFQQALKRTVTQTIADRRYDVQACHYQFVRGAMAELLGKGLVFGEHVPKEEWISKVCNQVAPNWVWVFFKVTGAPLAFSVNPMNMPNMWGVAERTREMAIENYVKFMELFGHKDVWVDEVEPFVLADEDLPPWWARD